MAMSSPSLYTEGRDCARLRAWVGFTSLVAKREELASPWSHACSLSTLSQRAGR